MEIIDKAKDVTYQMFIILVGYIPIAFMVTLVKTLISLKNKSESNFRDYLIEAIISVTLGSFVGYLALSYFEVSHSTATIATALTSWTGSKLKSTIDEYVNEKLSNIKQNAK